MWTVVVDLWEEVVEVRIALFDPFSKKFRGVVLEMREANVDPCVKIADENGWGPLN